ncbi:MAG: hydroxymethylpyrimidine/phosphomethylpyrimidine kinase [Flavobacteriaceae bacterium]|nr:hydroxymethylpyrimidine/phosphomethylpyrimidine kinase [Flavobacteriaceae bacterium]
MKKRPHILTIAGFDPSNGAGLTADVKTIETLKCYGVSVCTANTIQDDIEFKTCHWISVEVILDQIEILFKRFQIKYVKIGIVENWLTLSVLVDKLLQLNPSVKIVLDPVLKSSSNFDFHSNVTSSAVERSHQDLLDNILSKIYLLTPNYNEIEQLYPDKNIEETIAHISSKTNLFLKGGHHPNQLGKDVLFTLEGKQFSLNPKLKNCTEKHGSGCVLSSAITSYLALGFSLLKACYRGKRYTEKFLSSNKSLLGFHG